MLTRLLNPKAYTFFLLITGLLGVHIISFDLGFIQLSPYRLLLLLSPLVFLRIKKVTIRQLVQSKNYGYFAFMLFWVVYSIIPFIWVVDFAAWSKMYIFLLSGFITTWYIGLYLTSKEDIIRALKFVELLSVLFGIIAFVEIITGNYLFLNESHIDFYQDRSQLQSTISYRVPISIFANPNNYSIFLIFSIFFSFSLSKTKGTKIGRFISLVLTLVFSFLLIATQSRSGFFGLLLGITAYGLLELMRIGSSNMVKIIFFLVGVFVFLIPWIIDNRELYGALIEVDFSGSSGSDSTRINLIKNGFHFLLNSFFLGVGLGNIEYHMSYNSVYQVGYITNIHNWWMEILVSSGVVVFLYYLFVYVNSLKKLFKIFVHYQDREMKVISSVFFSVLVSFIVASMGPSSLMYNEWILPVIAVIMAFVNLHISNSGRV